MKSWLTLFAVALLFAGLPRQANGQVLDTYSAGYPIHLRIVVIPPDEIVRFQTDTALGSPTGGVGDTVLTLWDLVNDQMLAGADRWEPVGGCAAAGIGTPWEPSCFEYENTTSSTQVAWLIARSWQSWTPATTRLYGFGAGQPDGPLPDGYNGGSTAAVDIGGGSITHTLATSGRQYTSTAHMHGDSDRHLILVRDANSWDHAEDVFRVIPGWTGAPRVLGLAELDIVGTDGLPTSVGLTFGGFGIANTGPLRLLENDWFESGEDHDGDGLGHALEVSLGTCDRPTDTMPNGWACSNKEFCSPSATTGQDICLAGLRDTDHDGLRDDLEVYGFDHPQTHIARFGADPVHKDVFVELDTTDTNSAVGCQGWAIGGGSTAGRDPRFLGDPETTAAPDSFFVRAQQIYDALPAVWNPDGLPGINLHYDVGVPNPIAGDDTWGDWGGGGDCFELATVATLYGSLCANNMTEMRRAWFRWGVDAPDRGQYNNQGCYHARNTAQHVHELGHALGLSHEGPPGSSATSIGAANGWPLRISRMNYRYETLADTSNFSDWTAVTFSNGEGGQTSNDTVDEIMPVGPTANLRALGLTGDDVRENPDGSWDVNWDQANGFGGATHMAVNRDRENAVNARGYKALLTDTELGMDNYGSHGDAVVVNGVLVYGYVRYDYDWAGTTVPALYFKANSDPTCPVLPDSPSPGAPAVYGECIPIGFKRVFIPFVEAVSLAKTILPGGQEGLLVVHRDQDAALGSVLRWNLVNVQPSTNSVGATFTTTHSGTLTGPGGLGWPLQDPEIDVTLVEVPASSSNPNGGVMMFYQREATGGNYLVQSYLPPSSTSWSTPQAAQIYGSGSLGEVAGEVGATTRGVFTYLAVRQASGANVQIYLLPPSPDATTEWTSFAPVPGTGDATDVEVAFANPPAGSSAEEFFAFYVDEDGAGERVAMERRTTDFVNWTDERFMSRVDREHADMAPVVVMDQRGAPGLRAFRSTRYTCNGASNPFCTDPGYQPHSPVNLTCTGTYCEPSGGGEWSHIQYAPFANGLHPTEICDAADWAGIDFGICSHLQSRPAPTVMNGFIPTSYNEPVRCHNRPVYPEPNVLGNCSAGSILLGTSADDRALYPELYEPQPPVQCED